MIGAGDLAQDAAEREWERMTDSERIAALHAADADADAAYYAAMMAEAERAQATHIATEDARVAGLVQVGPYVYADPQCKFCRGTGIVSDTVDYGSTTAQLESPCECATDYEWAVTEGDGIAYTYRDVIFSTRRNVDGLYVLVSSINAPKVVYSTAAALLDMCATIAPLTAWQVVYDDQGADDAPKF